MRPFFLSMGRINGKPVGQRLMLVNDSGFGFARTILGFG